MTNSTCPVCGAALELRAAERAPSFAPPWRAHRMSEHRLGGGEGDTFTELTRTVPGRAASVASDVHVPLLQSLITSVAVTLSLSALTVAGGWSPAIPVFGFAATFTGSWLYLSADARSLRRTIEKATRRDIDGDGYIGAPAVVEPSEPVRVEVAERRDDGRLLSMRFLTLPDGVTESMLFDFCAGVVSGKPLSEAEWSGAGRPFSRAQFRALRDEFVARGLGEWIRGESSTQGWRLTRRGQLVVNALKSAAVNRAAAVPLPYPDDGNGAHAA